MSTSCLAQVDFSEQIKGKINEAIRKELDAGNGPAISVSVYHQGLTFDTALGIAKAGSSAKVNSKSIFLGASTSKVLVASAILRLAHQGKVDLEQPISQYVSPLHPNIGKRTLRQLLTHTAGLEDEPKDFGPGGVSQHIAYAKGLGDKDIFTQAGEVFSYSNNGYNLLGAVIESVTQSSFNQAMQDLVFSPIGIKSATYRKDQISSYSLAYGHDRSGNLMSSIPDNARERASGSIFINAPDFNRFLIWLMDQDEHAEGFALKQQMLQVLIGREQNGADWSYGYGLFHSQHCNTPVIWHTGGSPGYSATILFSPEKQFSIVVLNNGSKLNRWPIISAAMEAILEADCSPKPSLEPSLSDFTAQEAELMLGSYHQRIGPRLEIFQDKEQFKLKSGGQIYDAKKNAKGQLVCVKNGAINRTYSLYKNDQGEVLYLQYWVRSYPKR